MIIWSLRSFARCAGKQRTLEVWEEIKERWEPQENEMEAVVNVMKDLLTERTALSNPCEVPNAL
jgi:hypothetical protein